MSKWQRIGEYDKVQTLTDGRRLYINLPDGLEETNQGLAGPALNEVPAKSIDHVTNSNGYKILSHIISPRLPTDKIYITGFLLIPGRGVWARYQARTERKDVRYFTQATRAVTQPEALGVAVNAFDPDYPIENHIYRRLDILANSRGVWCRYNNDFFNFLEQQAYSSASWNLSTCYLIKAIQNAVSKIKKEPPYESISESLRSFMDTTIAIMEDLKPEEVVSMQQTINIVNPDVNLLPALFSNNMALHSTKAVVGIPAGLTRLHTIFNNPRLRKAMRSSSIQQWVRNGMGIPITKGTAKTILSRCLDVSQSKETCSRAVSLNWELLKFAGTVKSIPPEWAERLLQYLIMNGSKINYSPSIFDHVSYKKVINSLGRYGCKEKNILRYLSDISIMFERYKDPEKLSPRAKKRFPEGIKIGKWKTIQELHDKVSKRYTAISALEKSLHIPWKPEWRVLHGARYGNVRIVLPRTTSTVSRWGSTQSHCVASYGGKMRNGNCVIAAVYVDGKHKYTMELSKEHSEYVAHGISTQQSDSLQLTQLKGYRNSEPEEFDYLAICKILGDLGIENGLIKQEFIGYPDNKEYETHRLNIIEKHKHIVERNCPGYIWTNSPELFKNFTKDEEEKEKLSQAETA